MRRRLSRIACSLVVSGLIIASPVYASDETEAVPAEAISQTEAEPAEKADLKQQFLTDIAAGLNKRWEDNDKLSADESTDEGKKKSYETYVDDELQYVDKYRDVEFDDAQFDKLVKMYINGVDLQKKALEYFDDYKLVYNELQGAGYCARATATVDLVDYYKLDLPVDDVREFRDGLANDAIVYNISSEDLTAQPDTQSTDQDETEPLSIVSEEVKNASYGSLVITCGITNNTDKTISNINLTMAGYDGNNTVIGQGYGYLSTPLEAGQTANIDVSFTADDSIDTAKLTNYDLTYSESGEYKQGTFSDSGLSVKDGVKQQEDSAASIVVYDQDGYKISVDSINPNDTYNGGCTVKVTFQNLTHKNTCLQDNFQSPSYINGLDVNLSGVVNATSGKKGTDVFTAYNEDLKNAGIDKITDVTLNFSIIDTTSFETLANVGPFTFTVNDDGTFSSKQVYTDSETIQEVQSLLNAAGYDVGAADGVPGKKTNSMILQYEQDHGLKEDTAITDELLDSLRGQQ